MRTAMIIHGTEGHPGENWFPWLKDQLEQNDYKVIAPQFPSPPVVPAKITEWFEVFGQHKSQLDENSIIIGHSLGGLFTLRILEKLDHRITGVYLVGVPVGVKPLLNYDRDSAFCGFEFDWQRIRAGADRFVVYQSDNDPYVSLGNGEELAQQLNIDLSFIPNAGHFNTKAGYTEFPELLKEILR